MLAGAYYAVMTFFVERGCILTALKKVWCRHLWRPEDIGWSIYFYAIGILLGLAAGVFLFLEWRSCKKFKQEISCRDERIESLEQKLKDLNQIVAKTNLLKSYLKTIVTQCMNSIAERLDLSFSERVTLYKFDIKNNGFAIIDRKSKNTSYLIPGRDLYHCSEGIISKAWKIGQFYAGDLPDPEKQYASYQRAQERLGYTKDMLDKLTMKPRTYFAYRISSLDCRRSVALLMIESDKENFSDERTLRGTVEDFRDILFELLENFGDDIPRLTIAAEAGF